MVCKRSWRVHLRPGGCFPRQLTRRIAALCNADRFGLLITEFQRQSLVVDSAEDSVLLECEVRSQTLVGTLQRHEEDQDLTQTLISTTAIGLGQSVERPLYVMSFRNVLCLLNRHVQVISPKALKLASYCLRHELSGTFKFDLFLQKLTARLHGNTQKFKATF